MLLAACVPTMFVEDCGTSNIDGAVDTEWVPPIEWADFQRASAMPRRPLADARVGRSARGMRVRVEAATSLGGIWGMVVMEGEFGYEA